MDELRVVFTPSGWRLGISVHRDGWTWAWFGDGDMCPAPPSPDGFRISAYEIREDVLALVGHTWDSIPMMKMMLRPYLITTPTDRFDIRKVNTWRSCGREYGELVERELKRKGRKA